MMTPHIFAKSASVIEKRVDHFLTLARLLRLIDRAAASLRIHPCRVGAVREQPLHPARATPLELAARRLRALARQLLGGNHLLDYFQTLLMTLIRCVVNGLAVERVRTGLE